MVKKIVSVLVSTRLTAFLFLFFSAAMAIGTFVESKHGTDAAKILIYNAKWFELIILIFLVNFIFNIKRYSLLRREKLGILLLHLSWILIIIGAGVTRYIGYEGVMPIREGTTTNQFLSSETYLTVLVDGEVNGSQQRKEFESKVLFSEYKDKSLIQSKFFKGQNFKFDDQIFNIDFIDYVENVDYQVVESDSGSKFIKLVEATSGDRHDHYIESGQVTNLHGTLVAFDNFTIGAINFSEDQGILKIQAPFEGSYMRMIDQKRGKLQTGEVQDLQLRSLYEIGGFQFVVPDGIVRGAYEIVKNDDEETNQNLLRLKFSSRNSSKDINLLGGRGVTDNYERFSLGGLDFSVKYGSLISELPFSIKLNDFIAEKYPGTEKSYSSFMSKISVQENDTSFDYDIYMNNILNHQGYRFFQASFDPDELGTILSVNKDFYGTFLTYVGYIILYISLLTIMFYGRTRFKDVAKRLNKLTNKRLSTLIIFLFPIFIFSQHSNHSPNTSIPDSLTKKFIVDESHSDKFGQLLIQDSGGRMKPINTFSSELLRKVSKSDKFQSMNSDQVLLSIFRNPLAWYSEPIIYLKRGNDSLRSILNIPKTQKYAAFMDFFDIRGNYRLAPYLEDAYKSSLPNQFEKDFIESDRKVNLMFSALEGDILKIFPVPYDPNDKWIAPNESKEYYFEEFKDSLFINNIIPLYLRSLDSGISTKNYADANQLLESIKGYQIKYASDIIPSDEKIHAEIMYNKYDIFRNLFMYYFLAGLLFFIFIILNIFSENKSIHNFMKYIFIIFRSSIVLLFIAHTLGLIARWYISGHAPWGDAYESMIYVAWATMGIGLLFIKKSDLTLASTSFVTSMILMIAHWNWMDPSIANLVPVLNSYWLMIHVSVIVGSYGPFALSMILGFVSLLLIVFITRTNKEKIKNQLSELTMINELSVTVGLIMLTIGNFLGGMWANESWGRYWGWDPKETWALISILVYAFILHMRLIPKLRGKWLFNLMTILAFASIVMTYFGVNFYLVGLHSYASGDKVITPNFVYWSLFIVFVLAAMSRYKFVRYLKK